MVASGAGACGSGCTDRLSDAGFDAIARESGGHRKVRWLLGELFRRGFDDTRWINVPDFDEREAGLCPVIRFLFTHGTSMCACSSNQRQPSDPRPSGIPCGSSPPRSKTHGSTPGARNGPNGPKLAGRCEQPHDPTQHADMGVSRNTQTSQWKGVQ